MSKWWTPEEDLLIRIITRDGVAPVGSWTAFARVAGRSESATRARAQKLRKLDGNMARPERAPAPVPEPKRGWWAPWRKH